MKIIFIRHGATKGNLEKRYIGRTDESLCQEGLAALKIVKYPFADHVISSPMKRCTETVKLIYPNCRLFIFDDLRECDFGDFEGKNYAELNGGEYYQKWIDSGGTLEFPNGETPHDFCKRSCMEFLRAVKQFEDDESLAFVVHGGTIMSVLSEFAIPKLSYYDYHIPNGCGYLTEWNGQNIYIISELP